VCEMVARLGQVLYWAFCAIAVGLLLWGLGLSIFLYVEARDEEPYLFLLYGAVFVVFAVISYGVGRAVRYVLAGK
jgi:hypothetical protein